MFACRTAQDAAQGTRSARGAVALLSPSVRLATGLLLCQSGAKGPQASDSAGWVGWRRRGAVGRAAYLLDPVSGLLLGVHPLEQLDWGGAALDPRCH